MIKRRNEDFTVKDIANYLADMSGNCFWESRDFQEGLFYRAYISPETGELVDPAEVHDTIEFIELFDGEDLQDWKHETLNNIDFYAMCEDFAYDINNYVHEHMPITFDVETEFEDILKGVKDGIDYELKIYYAGKLVDTQTFFAYDYEECESDEEYREWLEDCFYDYYDVRQHGDYDYGYKIHVEFI